MMVNVLCLWIVSRWMVTNEVECAGNVLVDMMEMMLCAVTL